MELTLREFENLNLYSHKNMEKVIRKLVNESYNAALTSMFDDSVILLDHETGKFYSGDYHFNEETLTLIIDNFEEVSLVKEEGNFESSLSQFFEDEDMPVQDLVKSYQKNIVEQEKYIDDLISEVVSTKDFSNRIDYSQIKEAAKEAKLESAKERFVDIYKKRLDTHPLTEIKHFDWETPVKVCLMETEKHSVINTSMVEKAKTMWKRNDFKDFFLEAVKEFEDGYNEKMLSLFENFPVLFYLPEEDRLAVFGKTLLSSTFRENRKEIVNSIETLIKEDQEFNDLRENYISELEDEMGDEPADEPVSDEPADKPEADLELTTEEIKKLVSDLQAVHDKMDDGAEKTKLAGIIEKISSSEEEGTKPSEVKEAVSLLFI